MKINKISTYIYILHIIFLLISMPCSSNADPQVSELIDVAYGNGIFIAVGEDGNAQLSRYILKQLERRPKNYYGFLINLFLNKPGAKMKKGVIS